MGLEIPSINIGLIRNVTVNHNAVRIEFVADEYSCIYLPGVLTEIKEKVRSVRGVRQVEIEIAKDTLWVPEMMSRETGELIKKRREELRNRNMVLPWTMRGKSPS